MGNPDKAIPLEVDVNRIMEEIRAKAKERTQQEAGAECLFDQEIDVAAVMREIRQKIASDGKIDNWNFADEDELEGRLNNIYNEIDRINTFTLNTKSNAEFYAEPGRVIPISSSRPPIIKKIIFYLKRCVRKATRFLVLDQKAYNEKTGDCIKALSEVQEQTVLLTKILVKQICDLKAYQRGIDTEISNMAEKMSWLDDQVGEANEEVKAQLAINQEEKREIEKLQLSVSTFTSQIEDMQLQMGIITSQIEQIDTVKSQTDRMDAKRAVEINDYIDSEQAAITYAYRYLLNREPENKKLIINNERDWHQLREQFMVSTEYKLLHLDRSCFANMPFHSLEAEGVVYFFEKQDSIIPDYMLASGEHWAENDIRNFLRLADQLRYQGDPPKDGVFLDIGGNIGTTTIFCKSKLKPELRFIGFEPVSVLSRLFAANVAFNQIQDVVIENIGLSSQSQAEVPIIINHDNWGNSQIDFDRQAEADEFVCVTTLDIYMQEHCLKPSDIKYVWIDVEGHEPEVLEGAAAFYKENCVPTCIEFNQGIYMEQGKYENTLTLLGKYFRRFIVCSSVGTENERIRPICELNLLWEEFEGRSCDLILM